MRHESEKLYYESFQIAILKLNLHDKIYVPTK